MVLSLDKRVKSACALQKTRTRRPQNGKTEKEHAMLRKREQARCSNDNPLHSIALIPSIHRLWFSNELKIVYICLAAIDLSDV